MTATPQERSSAGRIGARVSWSRTVDKSRRTAPARAAFFRRFEDEVDPKRELPADVRARMADDAMKAYMAQISRRAKKKRAENAAKKKRPIDQ